ncbi:MAG TPA: hypothetical protein DCM32_08660 [Xanthomonadaceae bacterium]|jgi:hypothetical protein|nr:hypothetical protein [Xanthomonadaceae bacterium]
MAAWWDAVTAVMPWWAWALGAALAFAGFTFAWVSALAVLSAAGTHHGTLTPRQRRLARYASIASLAAVPLTAAVGLFALLAAAWALLA